MKTFKIEVTPREREAIYTALCRVARTQYNDQVYTPELLNLIETRSGIIELTIEQLRAVFEGLEVGKREPELDRVHRFEDVRKRLADECRSVHRLIC